MTHYESLVQIARSYLNLHEEGDNRGELIDKMNQMMGVAVGSPWCAAFVWHCLNECNFKTGVGSKLFKSANCMMIWEKSNKKLRKSEPEIGYLVVYQMYSKSGYATQAGHIGIVTSFKSAFEITDISGNTSVKNSVDREGRIVAENQRKLSKNDGTMRFVGFLDPFS